MKLDYPKDKINIYYLLNDSSDDSRNILLNFKKKYDSEYNKIYIDTYNRCVPNDQRTAEIRNKHIYTHLSILRNHILSKIKTDYLLSVDVDILIPSNSLKTLLSHNKDMISGLIYNGYIKQPTKPYLYTNIMKYNSDGVLRHISNYYTKNTLSLNKPKLLEVDVTGAFCLMKRKVAEDGKYGWHHQGEDVYFCNLVRQKGYKIYCDVSLFADHIMLFHNNNMKNITKEKNDEAKDVGVCQYD